MIINPAKILPAVLPPSVMGGGNAPSKRPQSGEPFASYIADLAGGDGASAAGQTATAGSPRVRLKRGATLPDDVPADTASADDDPNDPLAVAVAVAAWLWPAPDQPKTVAAPFIQSAAGTAVTAKSRSTPPEETPPASDVQSNPSLGAELLPSMAAVSLAVPTDQIALPALHGDPSALPAASQRVSAMPAEQAALSRPPVTVVVPTGSGADVELPNRAPLAPPNQSAAPAVAATTTTPASLADVPEAQPSAIPAPANQARPAVTDQMGSAPAAQNYRAGRAPAVYAEAAGSTARAAGPPSDRASVGPVAQPATGAVTVNAVSADASLPASRTTDTARAGDRSSAGGVVRAATLSVPVVDGQSAPAAAPMPGRAQSGTARNQAGQDSPQPFAETQTRTEEASTPAAQALEAAVATVALHPDHASLLAAGPATQMGHVPALESTSVTSPVSAIYASADRTAAIDDVNLHRQMVQAIHLQSSNGIGDARLTLQPAYLGEVTIALRVENGTVVAHVSAASADVREWLGANESLLRQGLSAHGLTLDRLIVSEEPPESPQDARDNQARQQQPQPENQPRPRPRRDAGTFEVTV